MPLTSGAEAMLAQFGTDGGRLVRRSGGHSRPHSGHGWPLGVYLVEQA
jgi:hypothetical protein